LHQTALILYAMPLQINQGNSADRGYTEKKVVFLANKYVSNGKVPEISHVVYVDPQSYYNIGS
jgi:hypothetical protein